MTITVETKTFKDGNEADFDGKVLHDSVAGTDNPCHAVLDGATGAPISPATAENQAEANTHLGQIEAATESTAAGLVAVNESLDAIESNTGELNTAIGARNDSAAGSDTGTFSLISLFKRALQSLTTLIGNTGAGGKSFFAAPAVTAGAYTSGMVVGGKISISNAVRSAGGAGVIQSVGISKRTTLTAPYDVIFFNADPVNSTFTDNAALAVNVADLDKIIGVVPCTNLISLGTPQLLQGLNAGLPFSLASGTTLFAVPVIRGAETYASTNAVTIGVDLIQS